MENISKFQEKLIKTCKQYMFLQERKKIDISTSALCFFTIWADTPGCYKIFNLAGINKRFNALFVLKNLFSISKNHYLDISFDITKIPSKKINLIISYSSKRNFDTNGNFKDDYFNFSSKDTNYFWILISLDNFVPRNIKNNIAIISYKKGLFKYNFLYLIKSFYTVFKDNRFNYKKIIHFCWEETNFAKKVSHLCNYLFKNLNIKNLILNYEGIPFQHQLLKDIKKIDSKIKTLGYLHCAPWPIQSDLIFKNQSLDNLIVSGKQQKNVLKKFLGWKKKRISVIPSLRFYKQNRNEFSGYLFAPYNLEKKNNYLKRLEEYLKKMKKKRLIKFSVRIHPLNKKSQIHQEFKKKCELIISSYLSNNRIKTSNHSLFFGSATGVCVQALEEGTTITHFPQNESLDVFSNKLWPNLKIKRIGDKIFEYKTKNKNQIFFTSKEKGKFKKYLFPLLKS